MREARLPRTGIHAPGPSDICRQGTGRAFTFQQRHREQQAARVAPAVDALAEKRKAWARNRSLRWIENHPEHFDLDHAPGHIQAMARETGMRK